MCQKRTERRDSEGSTSSTSPYYTELDNFMFILQFGPSTGQVRHIDNMVPNIQICLYLSQSCPTTIIYEIETNTIHNATSLCEYWTEQRQQQQQQSSSVNDDDDVVTVVPKLIIDILRTKSNIPLYELHYTLCYFNFWKTIDYHLSTFGKLYETVIYQHSLNSVPPGTILIAGGNDIHAGPPTTIPRMFAFAIGIPDDKTILSSENENDDDNDEG